MPTLGPGGKGAPAPGGRGAAPAGLGDLGRKWVDAVSAVDRHRARRSAPSPEVTGHRGFSGWLGKGTETGGWGGGAGLGGFLAAVWQLGLPGSGRVPGQLKEP